MVRHISSCCSQLLPSTHCNSMRWDWWSSTPVVWPLHRTDTAQLHRVCHPRASKYVPEQISVDVPICGWKHCSVWQVPAPLRWKARCPWHCNLQSGLLVAISESEPGEVSELAATSCTFFFPCSTSLPFSFMHTGKQLSLASVSRLCTYRLPGQVGSSVCGEGRGGRG